MYSNNTILDLPSLRDNIAKTLGLGMHESDSYTMSDVSVYVERDDTNKFLLLVNASSKELIGEPVDISSCNGWYSLIKPVEALLRAGCKSLGLRIVLRNDVDKEISFEDLDEAKSYYDMGDVNELKDAYIGADWSSYCDEFNYRANQIRTATDLESLATALNYMTDTYADGSQWFVMIV